MVERDEGAAEFARDGFCLLPETLTRRQVADLNGAIDDHRQRFPGLWLKRGEAGREQCVAILLTHPVFDETILHAKTLPLVHQLVGDELVVEEHSVMIRAPIADDPPAASWHRDRPHNIDHPLGIDALSVVFYLSDVDETTHCFSVVPESAQTKCDPHADHDCNGEGARDLLGPAGTALLFDAGSCHAGRLRRTTRERRTIHVYFGLASHPPLSNHTPMPRRLIEHEDQNVQRLFRRPNDLTKAILTQA